MKMFAGFDVAMNDSFQMGHIESVGELNSHVQSGFDVQGSSRNSVPQCHAIQKFHHNERLAVLLADLVNGADVGMVQRGSCLRFALKPGEGLRILRNFIGQKFERDKTAKLDVFGFVDDAHSAATELLDDAVMRDGLAYHLANASEYGGENGRELRSRL